MSKTQKKFKRAREKHPATYKGIPIKLATDFSAETLQARKEWDDIFKVLKGKKKILSAKKTISSNAIF